NKLLSSLYEKYDEKADSNYKPLTQSQKDSMKEDQIEKWEEKAKKGMLYHDQTLGKIIQEMRSAVTSKVEGLDSDYNSVFSLGISTTGLKGQLVLDEDKLKKALSEDSEAVYNVFAKLGNQTKTVNGQSVEDTSYNGIAQRLGDILTTATRNIRTRAGSSADITEDSDLNNLMRNLQTRMSNFKRMMNSFEDALYKRYDKMESMLAKLGTQLSFVMGGNS
ncbi:MAG: flagellar filament capping protein FliD, partial [Selenomonadaceae bacterium]|nr:flagellar filament capping protein FliD [Selenomonadaceae bacterium]